jgi:PKD repeat protein
MGYDLKVLKIGKKDLTDPPILFIQSAMHARELTTAALTLEFAKKLLNERENNADINWILENQQIHILFQTNPDGRKIAEQGEYHRKNVNQNHCPESSVGVDLNRNFSFGWGTVEGGSSGNACNQTYRGDSPGSEPEIAALENYVRSIFPDQRGPNVTDAAPEDTQGLYLDIHSYSQLILWPWGGRYDAAPNALGLESLGRKLAYFNSYTPMQSVGLYPTDGTSDNLAYGELGVAHITFELGTEFFQSCGYYNAIIKPTNLAALMYAAKVAKAPYQLTQGPDIIGIGMSASNDGVTLNATATDMRFSRVDGQLPNHAIARVRYSVNQLPTDTNSQQASFSDGNADSVSEAVTMQFTYSELTGNSTKVYLQAQDVSGYWGPISAYEIKLSPPVGEIITTCAGAKCQFSSPSTNQENSFEWQLSSGETSTDTEFEMFLPGLGDYSVTLKVTNATGLSSEFSNDFSVTELYAPQGQLTSSCDDLVCQFSATDLSDQDSQQLSVEWDLGDGNSSSEPTLTHTYSEAGSYAVNLTISDEHQQSTTISVNVEVTAAPAPTPAPAPAPAPTPEPETKSDSSGGSLNWFLLLGCFLLFRVKRHKLN